MPIIRFDLWGRTAAEDLHPYGWDAKTTDVFQNLMKNRNISQVISPECEFKTNIVHTNEAAVSDWWTSWFCRISKPADGVITETRREAIAIFNADCPVVAVLNERAGRLAVLHAGFRCLIPEQPRRGPRGRGIIQTLFEDRDFDTKTVKVFFGFGIGPCCYGAEHWPEMNDPTMDLPIGRATRGPRAGRRSLDLYRLIHKQLLDLKIDDRRIFHNLTCTSCAGTSFPKEPAYNSRTRTGPHTGTNAAVIWFE